MITKKTQPDMWGKGAEEKTFKIASDAVVDLATELLNGRVTDLSVENITIKTYENYWSSGESELTYEDKKEELLPLFELLFLYLYDNNIVRKSITLLFPSMAHGKRESLRLMAKIPSKHITSKMKVAALLVCGMTSEEDLKAVQKSDLNIINLIDAFRLSQEGECTFKEALKLAA